MNNEQYENLTSSLGSNWEDMSDEDLLKKLSNLGIELDKLGIPLEAFKANLIAAGNAIEEMQADFSRRGVDINQYSNISKISTASLNGFFDTLEDVYIREGS